MAWTSSPTRSVSARSREPQELKLGVKNSAAKGRDQEHKSRNILIAAGYWVQRAAGSKGPFDLIAMRPDGVVLVQVKSGRWPSPEERAELRAIPCPPNVRKEMHRWDRYARLPDIRSL